MNTIDTLKQLTNDLPAIPKLDDLIHNAGFNRNYIEYEVPSGTCIGFGLLNQKEVSVQKVVMTEGCNFPYHEHTSFEILVIFKGKLEVEIDGEKSILTIGDKVRFDKETPHAAHALEETWMIAISIPKDDGYPK